MSYKILITGGAGYIGSLLVPSLLSEGHQVTVLDNFLYKQASLLECCANPDFEIIRGDCRDESILKNAIEGKEFLLPLAALVGAPLCNYDKVAAETTNLGAIKTLLKLRFPEQKIIFPCTNSGYGTSLDGSDCTEDSPLNPVSLYGRTKVDAERAVLDGGNSAAFRLATVFGASPRMRLDLLVNDFVYRAVNDRAVVIFEGHFKRNYIHIRDVVSAFIHTIRNFDSMKGKTYNCGLSSANLSKLELCATIQKHIPGFVYFESHIGEDADKRDYAVSNKRLEATGWAPRYSLDDGIEELIKVYRMVKNQSYSNI
jgi:nucleoside-diphosphate-sugar epimerase